MGRTAKRLDFLTGLGSLLYIDETARVFREVDQLHPILIREPWVFGDEWDSSLSEHGLTTGECTPEMTYRFMEAEKADFPIRFMASRLGVSTSGFYDWRKRQAAPRSLLIYSGVGGLGNAVFGGWFWDNWGDVGY